MTPWEEAMEVVAWAGSSLRSKERGMEVMTDVRDVLQSLVPELVHEQWLVVLVISQLLTDIHLHLAEIRATRGPMTWEILERDSVTGQLWADYLSSRVGMHLSDIGNVFRTRQDNGLHAELLCRLAQDHLTFVQSMRMFQS